MTVRIKKMKIERLIGIIMILLQQDKITAPELAKRFEVSRRTINRDIEDICKAGIPLVTTQGHEGGISIEASYKVSKTFFSQEELQTILTGLKGIDSVSKTPHFNKVVEKLSSKENRIVSEEVVIIDLASYYYGPLSEKIAEIKSAILSRHTISFQYYYVKGESYRHIEPYRLIFKWSSWYVFGYCLDRKDYRLFKLNRLWDLCILETCFVPRNLESDALDLEEHFKTNTVHLKAIFKESEKYRLIEEYGVGSYSIYEGGRLLFERDYANYHVMREWLFSFGDKVEIVEPEELRMDRLQQAKNIMEQEKHHKLQNNTES